jgi:hypothetical protein
MVSRRCVTSFVFLINFFKKISSNPSWCEVGGEGRDPLFGYRYNQLPRLIGQAPQWLSGPSPLLSAAGPLADYQTGSKLCSDALQLLFNYWHGLT